MFQLFYGQHYDLKFMFLTAIYQAVLIISRATGLYDYSKQRVKNIGPSNYKHGIFLFLLGIAYIVINIYNYNFGHSEYYDKSIIFYIPLFSFIKFGIALGTLIKVKNYNDSSLSYIRQLSFSDALTSIVLTQNALMTWTGDVKEAVLSSAKLGLCAGLIILMFGVYNFVKSLINAY